MVKLANSCRRIKVLECCRVIHKREVDELVCRIHLAQISRLSMGNEHVPVISTDSLMESQWVL